MIHAIKGFRNIYSAQIHTASMRCIMIYYRPDSKNSMRTASLLLLSPPFPYGRGEIRVAFVRPSVCLSVYSSVRRVHSE